jgi:xanthine dehydrogenase small subunit
MPLTYTFDTQRYYTPPTLIALWDLLEREPQARIIAGGTDLSLEITKRYAEPPVLVSLEAIPELGRIHTSADKTRFGAGLNLTDMESQVQTSFPPLARILRYFGSRQIKTRATVGGNLCNASPIGDLAPVLLSLGARVGLLSRSGERTLPLEKFFLSYRKTALAAGEILGWVEVPNLPQGARASAYKVSKRRELDISTVAAGMYVELGPGDVVRTLRLGFGGMAAIPSRAPQTEAALVGQVWNRESVSKACDHLSRDFAPLTDHRGSSRYRALLARNLLRGFYEETRQAALPSLPDRPTATVQVT